LGNFVSPLTNDRAFSKLNRHMLWMLFRAPKEEPIGISARLLLSNHLGKIQHQSQRVCYFSKHKKIKRTLTPTQVLDFEPSLVFLRQPFSFQSQMSTLVIFRKVSGSGATAAAASIDALKVQFSDILGEISER
jgi:hypothetical protein